MDINESKTKKEEEIDPDFDNSDVLNLEEEQLNKEEEENKRKFVPIKFLVDKLREKNLNIKGKDEFDVELDKLNEEEIKTLMIINKLLCISYSLYIFYYGIV